MGKITIFYTIVQQHIFHDNSLNSLLITNLSAFDNNRMKFNLF